MSKPKILTREIAEEFLKDPEANPNSLSEFTTIEDAAAKVLAKHKRSLGLRGITTLSKAAASWLAKVAPVPGMHNCLHLNSLIPSIDVARQLAKYQGEQIVFGLASIDLPFVKAMAPFKGSLWLGNVTQLDDDVAGELAKRTTLPEYNEVSVSGAYLDGVQEYKDGPGHLALVSALVEWNKDHWLGLRGLKKISNSALVALAKYDGPDLRVDPSIKKQILDLKRNHAIAKIKEGKFSELQGSDSWWLADPSIKKQILALKQKQAIAKIKEGKLKEPEEWQNDRIVLSKPPLNPLKGRNAERSVATASLGIPKTVCKWFVEKLEDRHKVNISAGGYGEGKIKYISPEALELLRSKSIEWLWIMEKEIAAEKSRDRKQLESLATIKAPREFQSGRVVLPPPKKPLAEVYQWKPDFEGEDYAAVLHFYDYLPENHIGSIRDPNGYPAKTTSPEAAALYRSHRAFWEGKHAEAKAEAKAAATSRKKAAKENFEKAAASAGLSREELEAKLDRLGELVEQGNLKLAADMIAGFGETWLYEALLAGALLTAGGDLQPGKVLRRFKDQAELIMALTMAYMPKEAGVDSSIRTDAPVRMRVTVGNIDVVAEMIAPHLPQLKADVEHMYYLEKLHEPTAEFLVRHSEDLHLSNLKTLEIKEAMILSKLDGSLALRGLVQVDVEVATALAKIAGGLELGITDLPTTIAAILATTRGHLELSGLETISPEAAAALESHSGHLSLGEYDYVSFDLSVTSARHLARHKGPVSIPGLKRINADAAFALSELKHDLALESIEEFPDGVAGVKLCTKLVNSSPGDFRLNLKRLQPDCAAVLAECRGDLWLSVDEWNDGALLALASQQGRLEIDPKQISDTVGLALGQRSARSSLLINYTSVTLTDGAAEALGNYPGQLSFGEGIAISKEAATHLVKRSSMEVYRSKIKPAIRKIFEAAGSWSDTIWTRKP